MQTFVLDTNIVLDLFVFGDEAVQHLHAELSNGRVAWIATAAMREELARVLGYPQIASRLDWHGLHVQGVLARFDGHVRLCEAAPKAPVTCKDPDDQKFIDLAVAHRAALLSKDAAVLCMTRRLAALGVPVDRAWLPLAA